MTYILLSLNSGRVCIVLTYFFFLIMWQNSLLMPPGQGVFSVRKVSTMHSIFKQITVFHLYTHSFPPHLLVLLFPPFLLILFCSFLLLKESSLIYDASRGSRWALAKILQTTYLFLPKSYLYLLKICIQKVVYNISF